MPLGVVSNCFRYQLEAGQRLRYLCAWAFSNRHEHVELRQGSLGECEHGPDDVPDVEQLRDLGQVAPHWSFNLALGYPCFAPGNEGDDEVFRAGCAAISGLSPASTPHLRLVDLETDDLAVPAKVAAETLGRLLAAVRDVGGMLSIEHARQRWSWFREVFDRAREAAGDEGEWLKICFDPCNLLFDGSEPDLVEITASLDPAEVSMIHLKQRRNGQPWPAVAEGDVDWAAVVAAINGLDDGAGFDGPLLMEIAPSRGEKVWGFLEGSRVYLEKLGLDFRLRPLLFEDTQ